jgi:hypothetical protein
VSGLRRKESKWCQKEKIETCNNNVRLQCEKKATLGGNQRRHILRNERIQLDRQPIKGDVS